MKSLVFVVVTAVSSLSVAACFERFYTEKHLNDHPRQEVRSVFVESTDNYDFFSEEINVEIHFVRDGKSFIAQASGECFLNGTSDGSGGYCAFNDQGTGSATYTIKNWDDYTGKKDKSILFKMAKGFEYNDLSAGALPGQTIRITDYDRTFKVYKNELESGYDSKGCGEALKTAHKKSVSRLWNEVILHSVRNDLPRPTVTARNLFHLSALMWDVYAAYDDNHKGYYFKGSAPETKDLKADRDVALSLAAYTLLKERYKNAPGNGDVYPEYDGGSGDGETDYKLNKLYDRVLKRLGYNFSEANSAHGKFGIQLAQELLSSQLNDGSRESENYAPEKTYVLRNPEIMDISQSGMRSPIDLSAYGDNNVPIYDYFLSKHREYYGEDLSTLFDYDRVKDEYRFKVKNDIVSGPSIATEIDIDSWVKLFIPGAIDQGGNSQASAQEPLTVFWGKLPTFGNLDQYKTPGKEGVYFDPGKHLPKFSDNPDEVIKQNLQVIEYSALLNPMDMSEYDFDGDGVLDTNPGSSLIDISPRTLGNSTLGTNDKKGYLTNPVTGKLYEENMVRAADYHRSIAEFWADGPDSETPPGHWNTLANYTVDRLQEVKTPLKWKGVGSVLEREEYELKMYLTLNGALHDAAVVAWGIKGHYQGNRPVTVIRKLADMAEKDPSFAKRLVAYSPNLKMVTYRKTDLLADGTEVEKEYRKLAVRSWRGPSYGGFYDSVDGFAELRDLSFRHRDDLAVAENDAFGYQIAGVGWILAEHWMPYQRQTFVTPPFPGFVSGHSTFSRAAAEVLAGVTGSEFFPGGLGVYKAPPLHFEYDEIKPFEFQWATYFDASDASGLSRLYGGIHASYDDLPARVIGSEIGKEAVLKAQSLFE